MPIPGHGYNKLNAAYDFGGPKLLIETVQNVTGLPINHFMGIGFGGLVTVVNDVGGVRMCLKAPMKDPKAGLNLKAGCQTLNGDQALGFVRTRAFTEGDLQREQDQRVLLKGILSKMTSAGTLANPFAIVPAANGAASAITVDQGTGLTQLVSRRVRAAGPGDHHGAVRPVRDHERRVGRRVGHHGGEAVLQRPRPRPAAAEEPHLEDLRPGHHLTRAGHTVRSPACMQVGMPGYIVLTKSVHIGPCIDLHEPSWD